MMFKRILTGSSAVWALLLFWTCAVAADKVIPINISAPEAKALIDEENAFVVNVLSRIEFNIQHIPGSINIPINEIGTSDLLPADLRTPLIFYCMGPL